MEHLGNVSDVYSPWRDIDSIPGETLPRNSDLILDSNDCRSYNLYIKEEGVTWVKLRIDGWNGMSVSFTEPRSIFQERILY